MYLVRVIHVYEKIEEIAKNKVLKIPLTTPDYFSQTRIEGIEPDRSHDSNIDQKQSQKARKGNRAEDLNHA